jgi:hypothetical protein
MVTGVITIADAVPQALALGLEPADAIDDLVDALLPIDASRRGAGPAIELGVPLGSDPAGSCPRDALAAGVLRLLQRAEGAGDALRLRFVHDDSLQPFAAGLLESAFAHVRGHRSASIELRRKEPASTRDGKPALDLALARVTLNLPLLLMGCGGGGLKEALSGIGRGAGLALTAFQERVWLQRRGSAASMPAIYDLLGHGRAPAVPEADVEVWGLAHALGLLVRRGLVARPAVPEAAARLLGHLHYHLGEERDGVQFRVRIGGSTSRTVRKRMLDACEANARHFGFGDLAEELRNERAGEGVLPLAHPASDRRNRPLLSSRVVERLGPGLAVPEACLPGGLSWSALSQLRDASRLGTLWLAPAGSVGLFEVQEELFA